MSDMQDSLRELYQEVIFDHNRNPRNYRPLPAASHPFPCLHPLRALLRALRQPGMLVAGKHAPRQRRLPSPGLQPLPAMASTTKFLPSRR